MTGGRLAAIGAVAAALGANAAVAQPGSARAEAFAKLPDWTGIWIADSRSNLGLSGRPPPGAQQTAALLGPPYTEEWAAKVASRPRDPTLTECGFPFPFVMENPWVFQFLVTPEETAMIWGGREVRHIYTDGRGHPAAEDLWPTPWGDSVGRWEGDTLVVDTVAVQPSRFPPLLTEQARFTERLRMVGADRFEIALTIEDPVALKESWTITIPYQRVTTLDRMVHGLCDENERNPVVDGQLTIAPSER